MAAGDLLEFFGELVDGAKVVGGGGDLQVAGLEELLVAAVEQAGISPLSSQPGRASISTEPSRGGGDLCRAAVFPVPERRSECVLHRPGPGQHRIV